MRNTCVDQRAQAVVNLYTNPSVEGGGAQWSWAPGGGTAEGAPTIGDAYEGNTFFRLSWSVETTASDGGLTVGRQGTRPNIPYTSTVMVRPSKDQYLLSQFWQYDSSNAYLGAVNGVARFAPAGVWTPMTLSTVSKPMSVKITHLVRAVTPGFHWYPGDYLDGDAAMMTEGFAPYTYADGDSPGWRWMGAPNASQSVGWPTLA